MIKINFTDFWPQFDQQNLFLSFLQKHFNIEISDQPDYLIYSVYGNRHLNYENCIKIFFTGENIVPDFNLCDYALGFHHLKFEDRYLRFPLFVYYFLHYEKYMGIHIDDFTDKNLNNEKLTNRKFCNFIYSNNVNSDPVRDQLFQQLNKYKKVDSGGKHLNNLGKSVDNKLNFIRDYKFTIAFENSSVPGYTTEKILEPLIMNSLPVYYGNPCIEQDFNPVSFIRLKDKDLLEETIEEVIFLDKNDEAYLDKLSQPVFEKNFKTRWEKDLLQFFQNIFTQPFSKARRRPVFGFQKEYEEQMKVQNMLFNKRKKANQFKHHIRRLSFRS